MGRSIGNGAFGPLRGDHKNEQTLVCQYKRTAVSLMSHTIPFLELRPSAQGLRECGWQKVLESQPDQSFLNYSSAFFSAAGEAAEAGDVDREAAFATLGAACSMYYDENDSAEPLKPMIITSSGRSAALGDFQDQHLGPLSEVLSEIDDRPLRSRIADILWIRRRDHAAARIGAVDYLEMAKTAMNPEHWVDGYQALRRSAQLATSVGKSSPERDSVASYALNLLRELDGTDPLYLTMRLVQLLQENKLAAHSDLFPYLEACAKNAEERKDWMRAAEYWGAASNLRERSGDAEGGREALRNSGRAQVQVGESMSGNIGLASEHWLERGFQSLRQGQAPKEELVRLQQRLHELQKERSKRLPSIQTKVEIPEALVRALDLVKGQSFDDALRTWTFWVQISPKSKLREMVDEQRKTYLLASMFGTDKLSESGKTEIHIPPLPREGEPDPAVLDLHMWQQSDFLLQPSAWYVDYVRQIIASEHEIDEASFEPLLQDNPFVEPGREAIFAKGLTSAIKGDYLVAAHLLVPQIENSIRHLLGQHGVPTTFMRQDGTQEEYPLTKLVELEEFAAVLGEDLAFFMRGLLAHKAGSNLRNRIAHGLMSEGAFYSPASIVLAPLVLRLLIACKRIQEGPIEDDGDTGDLAA
jgi:hypothetical protein